MTHPAISNTPSTPAHCRRCWHTGPAPRLLKALGKPLLCAALGLPLATWAQSPDFGNPASNPFSNSNLLSPSSRQAPLPVEQAFALQALVSLPDTLILHWQIQDGYYLYRHSLAVEAESASANLGDLMLPSGVETEDEFFGEVEVYYQDLQATASFQSAEAQILTLMVTFQGCAEIGFCYPAHSQQIQVELPATQSAEN